MKSKLLLHSAVAVVALLAAAGCASTSAPDGWLPTDAEAQRQTFGAWIEVTHVDSARAGATLRGELIALDANAITVLTLDSLHRIPRRSVEEARLTAYDARHDRLGLWTAAGTFFTLSHGFVFIFSAPVWITVGGWATSRRSYHPVHRLSYANWNALRRFARFPQGLPPNVETADLTPKPHLPD